MSYRSAIVMFVLACVVAGKPAVARCLEGVKAAVQNPKTIVFKLTSMPDLSSLAGLKVNGLPRHLQAWEDGGRKSFSACRFQPGARVRLTGLVNSAHLNGRGGTVGRVDFATLKYTVTLDEAMDESGRRVVGVTEDKLEPEAV